MSGMYTHALRGGATQPEITSVLYVCECVCERERFMWRFFRFPYVQSIIGRIHSRRREKREESVRASE